jgi:uracil-DNA glycosylase family 4
MNEPKHPATAGPPAVSRERIRASLALWLDSDREFGIEDVACDRERLRRAAGPARGSAAPATSAATAPAASAGVPARSGWSPPPSRPPPAKPLSGNPLTGKPIPTLVPPLVQRLGDAGKRARLDALDAEVAACQACRLGATRTLAVPGEGNVDADLVFIGEGPGADEDRSGRPFVGPAGDLLSKIITAMGFSRETVFIANIVKCRPPGNRVPQKDEVDACSQFLRRQLEIVAPKVICTLGAPATRALLGVTTGITQLRGKLFDFHGIPVLPTFHPAYLLRTPEDKPLVWLDVQRVAKLVEERGGTLPHGGARARGKPPAAGPSGTT